MMWHSWSEFFAMGGYALYVWGSMAAVAACLLFEVLGLRLRARAIRGELAGARAAEAGQNIGEKFGDNVGENA
jgi:heme exporter protein D